MTIPETRHKNNLPFWKLDDKTGERSGFFVDLTEELFKEINETYVYVSDPAYDTYGGLGNDIS